MSTVYTNIVADFMRSCMICETGGHNVRACRNPEIVHFETDVQLLKVELNQLAYHLDERVDIDEFEAWLRMKDVKLVRAYALRRCGAFVRDDDDMCIEKIMTNLWGSESDLIPFEPVEPVAALVALVKKVIISDTKPETETEECAICYEQTNWTDMVVLNCDHKFCSNCIQTSMKCIQNMTCAMCRSEIETLTVTNRIIHENIVKLLSRR
jgi:hypothetical protein